MKRMDPHVYLFSLGHFSVDWVQGGIPALYFISVCHLSYRDATALLLGNVLLASVVQPVFGYYSDKVSKPWFVPFGPILSGILALSTMSATAWSGVSLMGAYCLGLGAPIVAVALGSARVVRRFDWFRRHHVGVSLASGGLLAAVGFLMITNLFAKLAGLVPELGI